jgi:transposase InsO family protein
MASLFCTLKAKFSHRNKFDNLDELEVGIRDYIGYYDHDRIKLKLRGMSPVKYRTKFGQS